MTAGELYETVDNLAASLKRQGEDLQKAVQDGAEQVALEFQDLRKELRDTNRLLCSIAESLGSIAAALASIAASQELKR